LSHVTCLSDTLYSEGESDKSRTEYQIEDIDTIKSLIPDESTNDEDGSESFDLSYLMNGQGAPMDFDDASAAAFDLEADSLLGDSWYGPFLIPCDVCTNAFSSLTNPNTIPFPLPSKALARSHSNPNPAINPFQHSRIPTPSSSAITPKSPFPPPPTPKAFSASVAAPHSAVGTPSAAISSQMEKNKYKCHCGYIPRGEEKWKPSNLARHKRTQHPVEAKVYNCRFPGCASTFTRSDNLRSHARDKGHEMKGDRKRWDMSGEDCEVKGDREDEGNGCEDRRRPSKRRKV
jgi:hypothetical protein